MKVIFIWTLLTYKWAFSSPSTVAPTYTAAVYEHARLGSPSNSPTENLLLNLETYKTHVEQAKSEGANIIVFPEYGLSSLHLTNYSRVAILPYLQRIADPKNTTINYCLESNEQVMVILSCIARNNSIYLVVNIGEVLSCDANRNGCPQDGRFQFNTNIAFDRNGTLVARQRKPYLFQGEDTYYNKAPEMEYVTFDTDFGVKFGIMNCFNIYFKEPVSTLTQNHNVTNFICTTKWYDSLPFFVATQTQEMFALARSSNLIAANLHQPKIFAMGSGIYDAHIGAVNYTYNTQEAGVLVTGRLSDTTVRPTEVETDHCAETPMPYTEDLSIFTSQVLLRFNQSQGRNQVCTGGVCCNAEVHSLGSSRNSALHLLAYNGTKNIRNLYAWGAQVCAIVQCRNESLSSCVQPPFDHSGSIYRFNLTAVSGDGALFHPSVLGTDLSLYPVSEYERAFSKTSNGREVIATLSGDGIPVYKSLLVASLYGRVYDWDKIPN